MNRKLFFLVSTVGLSIVMSACEPAAQSPTTTPSPVNPSPAETSPIGVPPATPTVTPTTP
ncbi:beta-Ig-H3/fasciclin [Mastigocladus laminosus UU774]|nr:beta-Ig-H3/fasciclin [Mastigocladus laminosus UU774]